MAACYLNFYNQLWVKVVMIALWGWDNALDSKATGLLKFAISLMTRCMASWTLYIWLSGGQRQLQLVHYYKVL